MLTGNRLGSSKRKILYVACRPLHCATYFYTGLMGNSTWKRTCGSNYFSPDATCTCENIWISFFNHIRHSMPATQDTDWIEVYAGQANCTKCIRYANYRGVKFDLLYSKFRKNGNKNKSDYMNILDPSGFLFLGQISTAHIQRMPHLC